MSECANCGGAVELVESDGGVETGEFTEEYACVECDATGKVTGHAENPPSEWTRYGTVFAAP